MTAPARHDLPPRTVAVLSGTKALLWDMDGLLVDSEPLWTLAEEALAAHYGAVWTDAIKAACMGRRVDTAVPIILAAFGAPAADYAFASAFLMERMVSLFHERLPLMEGALDLLALAAAQGTPSALVSSSFRVLVDAVVGELPPGTFVMTLAGDEVEHAKPHPEPYLTAASLLGVSPQDCVVLEDSASGATSGAAAGCRVVVVPGEHGPQGADARWTTVASLAELV